MIPLRPLEDRCLVAPCARSDTTPSGIVMAGELPPEVEGWVVAVGNGPRAEDGTLLDHFVGVGARVLFPAEAGHDVYLNRERYIMLREVDLLAIFED